MENLCYIGRKACGCIVMAIVDNPNYKKNTAKEIAKAIKGGLTIERVTCQYVRDNMRACECGKLAIEQETGGDHGNKNSV